MFGGWQSETNGCTKKDVVRSKEGLDELIGRVASKKEEWRDLPDARKVQYLKQMHANLYHASYDLADAADSVRGWDDQSCYLKHGGGIVSPALS
jgi:hypothetical protein